ncbi:MAG: hypothetical protein FWE88_02600 [Phycisphaerae bacterium]|nr:hypothetical protein [Phycisphaerae bacterium]
MKPLVMSFIVTLGLLAGCASSPSSPAVGAEAVYRTSVWTLDEVRASLPHIQKSATAAAEFYCNDPSDAGLAIEGGDWFRAELDHRSGGIMAVVAWWPREKFNGVVLYHLQSQARLADDLKNIAFYNERNCPVYLLGTADLLEQARLGGAKFADTIPVPAATVEGVSTVDLATVAVSWTWVCEFVAACTRQGKMPVMFQSIKFVPSGKERIDKHTLNPMMAQRRYTKFHDDLAVSPIPAGQLGKEWLTMARKRLDTLRAREMKNIRQAAKWAADAKASGGSAYFWSTTHVLGPIGRSVNNPTSLTPLPPVPKPDTPAEEQNPLGPGDFVLGIGYDAIVANEPPKLAWLRQSGAKVALSAANYRPENNTTAPGELFIDQHWPLGDADVIVPGYDVNIAPTSGLLAVEIYLMISAEINALEAASTKAAAKKAAKEAAAVTKAEKKAAKQIAANEAAAKKAHAKAVKAEAKAQKKAQKEDERELARCLGKRKRDYVIPIMLVTAKVALIATKITLHCVK